MHLPDTSADADKGGLRRGSDPTCCFLYPLYIYVYCQGVFWSSLPMILKLEAETTEMWMKRPRLLLAPNRLMRKRSPKTLLYHHHHICDPLPVAFVLIHLHFSIRTPTSPQAEHISSVSMVVRSRFSASVLPWTSRHVDSGPVQQSRYSADPSDAPFYGK